MSRACLILMLTLCVTGVFSGQTIGGDCNNTPSGQFIGGDCNGGMRTWTLASLLSIVVARLFLNN
ncbi:hypothetical protein PRIPAC_87878 [Pristionchus pacificus]|uniref:Uncharacterized protein n=1 Tax=Pristionchus pacificus TaxID=54126 RepID=A0A2A6B9E6_PRIPA|nr:hypothetical protein PRIPAC_87878 [Pristionchus pacificus]|eukprot:PDM62499.1 hypothetical protein PRIPAC_51941 [Pristionchus pacificus]